MDQGNRKKEAEQRATELLTLLGLEERVNHKPNQLSGGEQQRVSVARALVNHPGWYWPMNLPETWTPVPKMNYTSYFHFTGRTRTNIRNRHA